MRGLRPCGHQAAERQGPQRLLTRGGSRGKARGAQLWLSGGAPFEATFQKKERHALADMNNPPKFEVHWVWRRFLDPKMLGFRRVFLLTSLSDRVSTTRRHDVENWTASLGFLAGASLFLLDPAAKSDLESASR